MRLNLVFKFFIIAFAIISFSSNQKVWTKASYNYAFEFQILGDTLEPPVEDSELTDPRQGRRQRGVNPNLPDQSDTLVTPIEELMPEDVLDNETEDDSADTTDDDQPQAKDRKKGSAQMLDDIVDYSAKDSIRFDLRNQIVHLYGKAEMKYTNIHLTADYINVDFQKKELFATGLPDSLDQLQGLPIFREGSQEFESLEIRYNFETQRGRTVQVFTEEADGFMHGDVVKMMEDKVIYVSDGKFTTCDDPTPHFHISFRKAKIIPQDKIITSLAYLTIADVKTPILVPFGFFPNKQEQSTGIIIPSYGETRNRGFYLENGGVYFAMNDYMDLSLTGDIYSRGSWAIKSNYRYRQRYKFTGNFNFNWAVNLLGEPNLPDYERSRDFRVIWNHSQDPKAHPNRRFNASVNAGSSQYDRFNPISTQDYLSNTRSSSISYSYNWGGLYSFSANARYSENTSTNMVDLSLPELTFSVGRFHPFRRKNPEGNLRWYEEITMNYNMNATNQISTLDSLLLTEQTLQEMRNGVQHSIPLSHNIRVLNHFNLTNSINYTERWYFQRIERGWQADELPEDWEEGDNIPGSVVRDTIFGFHGVRDFNYSTSLNTKLYGMMQFRSGPVSAARHVLSPTLGFSIRPDYADEFWGYYNYYDDPNQDEPVRYSLFEGARYGTPQAGRSGAINFSLGNNFEIKVRSRRDTIDGERKIALIDNFTVSSSYDIAKDSLQLSNLRLSGRTRLFNRFDITYSSSFSPYETDSMGRQINTFLWENSNQFYQLQNTNWALNFNYNLSSADFGVGSKNGDQDRNGGTDPFGGDMNPETGMQNNGFAPPGALDEENGDLRNDIPSNGEIDYSLPWSLRFSYSFRHDTRISRPDLERDRDFTQSLSFSGDVSLTPNWRIGFRSGYDFDQKKLTYTSLDIYRDLHCWELTVNWVPFGFRQSYNMTLRVKSNVLQDLKVSRRRQHLDRAFN